MRNVLFILLFTLCSQYIQAQAEFDMQIDPKKLNDYLKKNKPAQQKMTPSMLLQLPSDTVRYSHTIVQGDVYALPQDNMPCLVPDKNAYFYNEPQLLFLQKQPYSLRNDTLLVKPSPDNQMPNAYRGKPLVWEKKP